jgi:hypothetical protein
MTRPTSLAAFALLSLVTIAPYASAQGVPTKAAEAARRAKLRAQQAAAIAAARTTPTATPKPVVTAPRVIATTPPAATVAPKATTAATTPVPSSGAKPSTSAAPATSAVPTASPTHIETQAIALDLAALKQSRPDRRHAEFLDLEARWGGLLSDARAAAELKQHAQRVAYLQRIRALGTKANDLNFVKSVDAVIATEETRDENALNALRGGALPATAPTPVAATATAVAVPVGSAPVAGGAK